MGADCLFCKIVSGAIPCTKVDETVHSLAFRDLHPQAPTHILLIPKRHLADSAEQLGAAHAAALGDLFGLAVRVAKKESLTKGWRLVTNVGDQGGQTVQHFHVHLLGGRPMQWPPG